MCTVSSRRSNPQPAIIAAADNTEATRAADIESALRRRRAGAAANVLTSPVGIPSGRTSTPTMGGVAP